MKNIIIIFALVLFFGCEKSQIIKLADFSDPRIDSSLVFIPKKIRYSKVGILRDTLKTKLLISRGSGKCVIVNKKERNASYFIVIVFKDTIRIISHCNKPKFNDSLQYDILGLRDSITLFPTKPLLYKYFLPSYGNIPFYEDTAKLVTIFGLPLYHIRPIPSNLNDCIKELDFILSEDEKDLFRNKYEELGLHMGIGMWIRNNWVHGGGTNLSEYFDNRGTTHPDHMSGKILHAFDAYLRGQDIENPRIIRGWIFLDTNWIEKDIDTIVMTDKINKKIFKLKQEPKYSHFIHSIMIGRSINDDSYSNLIEEFKSDFSTDTIVFSGNDDSLNIWTLRGDSRIFRRIVSDTLIKKIYKRI